MEKMNMNKINRQNNRIFSRYAFDQAMADFDETGKKYTCKRLRSCQAWVYSSDHWFILKSYDTFVACINRDTGVAYDVLRYVYGYTATSAQHISKFFNDYNAIRFVRYCPD